MDAVILAAGRGSRLRPLTDTVHKTLLNVGSESILEHQIKAFSNAGIDTIHIITGYRHEEVTNAALEYASDLFVSINIINSKKWDKTDNLYSLSLAESVVRGRSFVLSNADVFTDETLIDAICQKSRAVVPYDSTMYHPEELKLNLDLDGSPVGIIDKGKKNGAGATIGMFLFDSAASTMLFEDINTHISTDQTQWFEASLDRIFSDAEFETLDVSSWNWIEIDTEKDLRDAWKRWTNRSPDNYIESLYPVEHDN